MIGSSAERQKPFTTKVTGAMMGPTIVAVI